MKGKLDRSIDPLVEKVWAEIERLDLERAVAELEVKGFTVIPPDIACPDGLATRLLEGCLDVAATRYGVRPDPVAEDARTPSQAARFDGALGAKQGESPIGDMMQSLITEGPVFEEALMNPVVLAMGTFLVGYSATLLTMACFIKGPNETELPLHCDSLGTSPLQANATECNMTYALTDYTFDDGCLAVVPGSHRWCRPPSPGERSVVENPAAVPVECEAGSIVCWHGATWHGAFPRRTPGLRVSVVVDFVRSHIRAAENLSGRLSDEALERNSARFAVLTQQGYSATVPDAQENAANQKRAHRVRKAYYEELGVNLAESTSPYA